MKRRKKWPPNFQLQYDPAEIPRLAAQYMATPYKGRTFADEDREMESAGSRIASGEVTLENLKVVCEWKSTRRIALLNNNTSAEVEQALTNAISATEVKEAVYSLICLHGVAVKMASAILTAINPERYTVLDFRALEALGVEDGQDVDLYVLYVETCRNIAEKYGVKLRDFDRANWQWSKRLPHDTGATHCRV